MAHPGPLPGARLRDVVFMDYASTSALRPPVVAAAVYRYLTEIGATPGRASHRLAVEAGRLVLRCRQAVASLLGVPGDDARITFASSATHAINTALRGVLEPRDAVVVTAYDHNAVLRPCYRLARERDLQIRMLAGSPDGSIDMEAAAQALDGARLLVLNGASNVLGTRLPINALGRLAREAGALVLVDAAQLAGHVTLDLAREPIDMLAFSGHKGMLGPQGTGGLWIREGIAVEPLMYGGTGGDSLEREMPAVLPDGLEAGTLNGPGLAGLLAGLEWLRRATPAVLQQRSQELKQRLRDGLAGQRGVRVLSPAGTDGVPIVTIVAVDIAPSELAHRLDVQTDVLTRAGLHCAPEVHRLLGTDRTGAVRFSLGWATTEEDVDRAISAVHQILDRECVRGTGFDASDTTASAARLDTP